MKLPHVAPLVPFRKVTQRWRSAALTTFLGKWVILAASLLHIAWAVLLLVDERAGASTPLHIVVVICGGRYRAAVVLCLVAVAALAFPFIQIPVSNLAVTLMLLPQQIVLLMSAGAGVRAALYSHYADGVIRPQAFILSDQMAMLALALLYVVTVLQVASGMTKRREAVLTPNRRVDDP
jgi:hypothetical protein